MLWFPLLAAGATVAFAGKIVSRHLHGRLARSALIDPDGIRTVARFTTGNPTQVLRAVASELSADEPLEVTGDAVRGRSAQGRVDIVRLASCGPALPGEPVPSGFASEPPGEQVPLGYASEPPGEQVPLGYTLTLTRAWTGAQLDSHALELLAQLHAALVGAGVGELAWHPRQDRDLRDGHAHPYY